ncbi:MAG: DUF3365 domain-containing protein [Desulfomonile tiedjei]|nr:DUF3365 domain-containing protein [Desulfomonile tiedjei]
MRTTKGIDGRDRSLRRYSYLLMAMWSATILGTLAWDIAEHRETTEWLANHVALAHFNKDQAFRFWATSHGGVYVPADERTPPNPHLEGLTERDIETPSGKKLTLMNPSYMLRQLHRDFAELYGVGGHITSLNPLRPENRPDEWEKKALEAFERGETEVAEVTEIDGKPCLRLMRPMICAKGCLKCHPYYREGDVRGGAGVALPIGAFLEAQRLDTRTHLVTHGSVFAIGLVGIFLGMGRLERREQERDQAREELQAASAYNRSLIEACLDPLVTVSAQGAITDVNTATESVTGYARDELIGTDLSHYFTDPQKARAGYRKAFEAGSLRDYELEIRHKSGALTPVMYNACVYRSASGRIVGLFAAARDITERKLAEAERERLIAELEAKNTELERFTYSVSHDLKSPLITIKSFVGFIEADAAGGNLENLQPDLERISNAAEKMGRLLEEILELSRIGRMINPSTEISMHDLVGEVVELLSGRLLESAVDVKIAPDLPIVYGDRPRMFEVLQNLIENAVKFMGDQPHPFIEIGARQEGPETVFYVRDNGVGIEPSHQDRVFRLFDKLDEQTEGTGIGLALVKRIIEVHGGRIWLESEGLGKGCTFSFTLPRAAEPRETETPI